MRIFFVCFLLSILVCCKKTSTEVQSITNNNQVKEIKEPLFSIDKLDLGELAIKNKIQYIKRYSYGYDNYYYFDYYPNTNKIKTIIYKPSADPRSCAGGQYDFFYVNNKIDKVEVREPTTACEILVKSYQFNYFSLGALKSIIETNSDYYSDETFFSYNLQRRIDKIFQNFRNKAEKEYRFNETSFKYDSLGNVAEVNSQPSYSDKITERTTFIYDSSKNPFKGNFIIRNFVFAFGWNESIGPFFLSTNNVKQTTKFILGNGAVQTYPYKIVYNNNQLFQYYYFDQFGSTFYYF